MTCKPAPRRSSGTFFGGEGGWKQTLHFTFAMYLLHGGLMEELTVVDHLVLSDWGHLLQFLF